MPSTVVDVLAAGCLLSGAVLSLAAGVGLLRFPDLLSRMHAATKPQVLGLLLILSGTALRLGTVVDITTLVLVGVFQLGTAPVAAHMVGRAVYRAGQYRRDLLVTDELAAANGSTTAAPADGGPADGGTADGGTADGGGPVDQTSGKPT